MASLLRALVDLRAPAVRASYGEHPEQVAELHLPAGEGPHPVVVALHGGFWRPRYTRRYMRPLCAELARNGWAAWNVEYRRVGRAQGGGWPQTFADVAAGIDHLADAGQPLDLTRVVALGHSAGAHLALWAATRATLPAGAPGARPRVELAGVVAVAAASDLVAPASLAAPGGAVHDLMHTSPSDAPDDRYALANPIRRLPLGLPALVVHGEADETIPLRRSRDFAAAARAAGDTHVTLLELAGTDHRAVVDPRRRGRQEVLDWLAERR
jgi:acetyl esterase/lipase